LLFDWFFGFGGVFGVFVFCFLYSSLSLPTLLLPPLSSPSPSFFSLPSLFLSPSVLFPPSCPFVFFFSPFVLRFAPSLSSLVVLGPFFSFRYPPSSQPSRARLLEIQATMDMPSFQATFCVVSIGFSDMPGFEKSLSPSLDAINPNVRLYHHCGHIIIRWWLVRCLGCPIKQVLHCVIAPLLHAAFGCPRRRAIST